MQGIIGHRSEGFSKMVTYSFILHFLFMGTVVLSKDLWGPRIPDFHSYNVSLVPGGVGLPPPSRPRGALSVRSAESTTSGLNQKIKSPPNLKISPPAPSVRSKSPAIPKVSAPKNVAKDSGPSVQSANSSPAAIAESNKAAFVPKIDPEDLPDWKKKSRSMKLPEIPEELPLRRNTSPIRKTAKIEFPKRGNVLPREKVLVEPLPPAKSLQKSTGLNTSQALNQVDSPPLKPTLSPNVNTAPSDGFEGDGLSPPNTFSENGASASIQSPLRGGFGQGMTGTGSASVDQSFFGFPSYIQKINNKISGRWSPPPVTIRENQIGVVIRFDIKKSGNIDKETIVVEKSSGNSFFDQAAMRAVYRSHPLPPLPGRFSDNKLTIHFSFTVKEDS
ncbi:MAG: TonB family protein [Nitrospiria bacterium]